MDNKTVAVQGQSIDRTGYRDFLTPAASASHGNEGGQPSLESLGLLSVLYDIRRELLKQNPDVLCMGAVQGSANNVINDLQTHEVVFLQGLRKRTVYQIIAWSTYTTAFMNIVRGNPNDGFALTASPVSIYAPLESVYVSLSALNGSGAPLNGNTVAGTGGLFIYGFTIPDQEATLANKY